MTYAMLQIRRYRAHERARKIIGNHAWGDLGCILMMEDPHLKAFETQLGNYEDTNKTSYEEGSMRDDINVLFDRVDELTKKVMAIEKVCIKE